MVETITVWDDPITGLGYDFLRTEGYPTVCLLLKEDGKEYLRNNLSADAYAILGLSSSGAAYYSIQKGRVLLCMDMIKPERLTFYTELIRSANKTHGIDPRIVEPYFRFMLAEYVFKAFGLHFNIGLTATSESILQTGPVPIIA